jgi:endonuclease YncB( thermonuclease family)
MRAILFFALLSNACVSHGGFDACSHDASTLRCVAYVRNYDADTVTVSVPDIHPLFGHEISVRLRGIDTPELKTEDDCEKKLALEAKAVVANVLRNANRIELQDIDRDKYFRVLANVVVDGESLSDLLLRSHLAYPYDGGTKRRIDWCAFRVGGEKK